MASKTKKKSKYSKKFKIIASLLAVLLVAILTTVTILRINHNNNQKLLKEDLEATGEALDVLAGRFKKASPKPQAELTSECYEASVKYGTSPINCTQSLRLVGASFNESQVKILEGLLMSDGVLAFSKVTNDLGLVVYSSPSVENTSSCTAVLSDSGVDIDCIFGDFDEFIYPERSEY